MLVRQVAAIITCYWVVVTAIITEVLAIIVVYTHSESPQQIIDPTLAESELLYLREFLNKLLPDISKSI